jgi:hypothetical protein
VTSSNLEPRHIEFLEEWAEYAETNSKSEYYDFTSGNRNDRVHRRLREFVSEPTNEAFEALWTKDVLRDALIGGPALVRNNWPGSIEELASLFETMQSAEEYDPEWETEFIVPTPLWELFGHMQPSDRPIMNGQVFTGLDRFGFARPATYYDRAGYVRFVEAYETVVGHATSGTDHEVPLAVEIEQFLSIAATEDRHEFHADAST